VLFLAWSESPRAASQETGLRRDCWRATGGVHRGSGLARTRLSSLQNGIGAPVPRATEARLRPILLAVLLTALPSAAFSQSPNTIAPEVVVTATRVPTPVTEIPAGVSVIDRQTIQVNDYTDLVQALVTVPGINVSQSGGPGGNASVFIRGTNSDHVLVLRDGMPINDPSDANGAFNFGLGTLADIERIEIIRGPMGALYGSAAIGGVINFISRRGTEPGPHVSGDLSGGYPRQVLGNANLSGVNGPLDYSLTYEAQSLRGYDVTPPRESIYTGVPDGFRTEVGTLNLGYTPVEGTRVSLFLRGSTTTFGFNNLGSPTFDNANATGRSNEWLGRIGVTSKPFGDVYETSLYLGRLQDDRQYTEPLYAADPNQATENDRYHAYRTDFQWNNVVHLNDLFASSVLSGTDLTFGYEHTSDQAKVRVDTTSFGSPYMSSTHAHLDDDAGYAGLQTTIRDRLTLTGQIRQDAVLNQTPFTWRLGAVLAVPELLSRVHVAYGTAFRAPSLFDRYGVDSFGYVGNPSLRPERAQGWEVGLSSDLPFRGRANFLSTSVTYFNEQIRDLIETVFTPVYTAVNIGAAHTEGVETEATARPAPWLTATAAWTYTEAKDADTGSQLLQRPMHTASFTLTAKPIPLLTIAPQLLYTGPFESYLVNNAGFSTSNITTAKPGLILNLAITYQLTPHVELYAKGGNLTNSHFEPVNGYAIWGPWFLAGARARF
jgi:vitamin B12 transporter